MRGRRVEQALWLTALSCFAFAAWSQRHTRLTSAPSPDSSPTLPLLAMAASDSVRAWSRIVANTNPFRFTRLPSSLRFGEVSTTATAAPEARPRPSLTLLGTIGGPPWQGVVAGLPGRNGGVVVRSGQQIDSFVVRSVAKDKVVIAGTDTLWVLTVRQPWK